MASLLNNNNNNNNDDDERKGDDDDSNDIEFLRERTDSLEIEERRLQAVEDGTLIDLSIDEDDEKAKLIQQYSHELKISQTNATKLIDKYYKILLTLGDDGIQFVLDTVNIMKEENEEEVQNRESNYLTRD